MILCKRVGKANAAVIGLALLGLIVLGAVLAASGRLGLGKPKHQRPAPDVAPNGVPGRAESSTGWLRITTHPAGAHVFVKEALGRAEFRYLGRTPYKKQLRIGRYQVILFLNGTLVEREQRVTTTGEQAELEIRLPAAQHPEMVYVKPGWFQLGSEKGEVDERPTRRVFLDGYYIDKHELSNRRYGLFLSYLQAMPSEAHKYCHPLEAELKSNLNHTPSKLNSVRSLHGRKPFNLPTQPVTSVTWFDAYAYAKWAGKQLPTEAQWEKAAGWNDERKIKFDYPWGAEDDFKKAHVGKSRDCTANVDAYPDGKSFYGCYQMIGNVYEWCLDWWDPQSYAKMTPRDPRGPKQPVEKDGPGLRVVRGGSGNFFHFTNVMRRTTYARYKLVPKLRDMNVGFRCVINVAPKKK